VIARADRALRRVAAGALVVIRGRRRPSSAPHSARSCWSTGPTRAGAHRGGHEGISRTADDRIASSIFNLVVGGSGFSSRLMARAAQRRGAHLRRQLLLLAAPRAGPFFASTFTRVEKTRTALDVLLAELDARAQRSARRARSSAGRARSRRAASRWVSRRAMR
jgi:hypothetical protein